MEKANKVDMPTRHGFDPSLVGSRAECDGGGPVPGTHFAGREDFAGTLTGEYVDHGDPPWRWYLLTNLSRKPPGYSADAVWCESESLFLIDAEGRTLPDSLSGTRSET
jgi:hypothetical protein